MDEKIILVIVLFLNVVLSILGLFLTEFYWISASWNIISLLSLAIIAYMVYDNSRKIDTIEKNYSKKFNEMEKVDKLNKELAEELEKRLKRLEEKEKTD